MDVFIIIILLIYLHLDAPATVEKVQQACSLDPTMFHGYTVDRGV